jgi:hypothetical protein
LSAERRDTKRLLAQQTAQALKLGSDGDVRPGRRMAFQVSAQNSHEAVDCRAMANVEQPPPPKRNAYPTQC